MTDQERISRMAEWMGGWQRDRLHDHGIGWLMQHWNPQATLGDAWMLVERITSPPKTHIEAEKALNTKFILWWMEEPLWAYSSRKAATRIFTTVERLMEGK